MILELSNLINKPEGSEELFQIKEKVDELDEEVKSKELILGKVRFTRIKDGVLGAFQIKAILELMCVRCLEKFIQNFDIKFEQEYIFEKIEAADLIEKEEQAEGFIINKNNEVDIFPAIRQEILVNLPYKQICRENCKGLCSECGNNLNKGKKCKHN